MAYHLLMKQRVEPVAEYGKLDSHVCTGRNVDVRTPGPVYAKIRAHSCVAKCAEPPWKLEHTTGAGNATCASGSVVSDCSCTGENCTGSFPDHEDNRCESFGRGTTATARCARLRDLPLDYATARLGAAAVPWHTESESRATEAVVWNTETNAGDGTATATCRELTQVASCGCYAHKSTCSTVYTEDEKRCTATADTGGAPVTVWLRCAWFGDVTLSTTAATCAAEDSTVGFAGGIRICATLPASSGCSGYFGSTRSGLTAKGVFNPTDLELTSVYWPEVLESDGELSDALCVEKSVCEEFCNELRAVGEDCGSYEMHATLPRCFLNVAAKQPGVSGMAPAADAKKLPKPTEDQVRPASCLDEWRSEGLKATEKCGGPDLADTTMDGKYCDVDGGVLKTECEKQGGVCSGVYNFYWFRGDQPYHGTPADPGASSPTLLRFRGIQAQEAGTYKVCFCDGSAGCTRAEDFAMEIGELRSSGLKCMAAEPELASCMEQYHGGYTCGPARRRAAPSALPAYGWAPHRRRTESAKDELPTSWNHNEKLNVTNVYGDIFTGPDQVNLVEPSYGLRPSDLIGEDL
jgi:hypothetical protein